MRLRLDSTCAGDLRVRCLREKPPASKVSAAGGPPLVCSSELSDETLFDIRRSYVGYGDISKGTTFGKSARAMVRQCGSVLDEAPRSKLVFLTGTLPGSTLEAYQAMSAWSGWLVKCLLQWLHDTKYGEKYFGVWEWQRRGALHLHIAVECPTECAAWKLRQAWKARWIALLDGLMLRSGVDIYRRHNGDSWVSRKWVTRTDAQQVERSVSRYLAKYLSKGSTKLLRHCMYAPSRWWFASKSVRTAVAERALEIEVTGLPEGTAIGLKDKAVALLTAQTTKTYTYVSPADRMVQGCISLLQPLESRMVFDWFSQQLRCLMGWNNPRLLDRKLSPSVVACLFGGVTLHPG